MTNGENMNRKQMLETIASQSGCSLRKVRKAVFSRAAENKHHYSHILFNDAIINPNVDWEDYNTLIGTKKYDRPYTFHVVNLPSGFVVLFKVPRKGYESMNDTVGARLTLRSFLVRK